MITEINGFQIDVYNQHKLDEKSQGICPLCSHDRKPKNQKAKCASYEEKVRLRKYMKNLNPSKKILNTKYRMQ